MVAPGYILAGKRVNNVLSTIGIAVGVQQFECVAVGNKDHFKVAQQQQRRSSNPEVLGHEAGNRVRVDNLTLAFEHRVYEPAIGTSDIGRVREHLGRRLPCLFADSADGNTGGESKDSACKNQPLTLADRGKVVLETWCFFSLRSGFVHHEVLCSSWLMTMIVAAFRLLTGRDQCRQRVADGPQIVW